MESIRIQLKLKFKEHNINRELIDTIDESSLQKVYNLFVKDEQVEPATPVEMVYFGQYYHYIKSEYDKAKSLYLKAIELGNNTRAMNNLGILYQRVEKNYELAKKYYMMAIEHGSIYAPLNLGIYYQQVEYDYELAKKYYLVGCDRNEKGAMNNLGFIYYNVEKNQKLGKKYFVMSYKLGNKIASKNLGDFYFVKGKPEKALEYFMSHYKYNVTKIIELLSEKEHMLKFIGHYKSLVKRLKSQQLEIEHLRFKPDGPGAKEAKSHFEELSSK